MKKISLSMVAVILAALLWTSCIDNAVSPEVQAIRAAQVDLIKARTAFQDAETALKNAMVDFQKIKNDEEKATLADQIAYNAQKAAEYAYAVKEAELILQQKIDALAEYLKEHKLEMAAAYLSEYESAMNDLANLIDDKADAQYDLDQAKQLISYDNQGDNPSYDYIPYQLIKDRLTRELAQANAILAADQASLTAMKAAAVDPAANQALLATTKAQIQTLEAKSVQLDLDYEKAEEAYNLASARLYGGYTDGCNYNCNVYLNGLYNDLYDFSSDQASYSNQIAAYDQSIISDNANIVYYTNQITIRTAELATANAALVAANSNLATAQAAQVAKQTAWNTAKADYDTKLNAKTVADANLDVANTNLAAAPADPALIAAQAAAATAATSANTALTTSTTALNTATTNLNAANADVNQYQSAVNTANSNVNTANVNLNNDNDNLRAAQTSLLETQTDRAQAVADQADAKTKYDAAKANEAAYVTAYQTANTAYNKASEAYDINLESLDNLYLLADELENFINPYYGVNGAIADMEEQVEGSKADAAAAQALLNDLTDDQNYDTNIIAYYQAVLDSVNAQIASTTTLAAKWKALLDAALA